MVALVHFVYQVRRPEGADPFGPHQVAHVGEDAGAGLYVQPDRRLVEQQQRRPVEQCAGDLDAPHLAAGQAARLVVQAPAHLDGLQHGIDAPSRLGRAHAVQRGMVGKVLVDAQIEIQRARLEDDAEASQRRSGRAADVVPEDADRAVARVVEMADQREQRRFARPVEA